MRSFFGRAVRFVAKRWFLFALLVVIPLGLLAGRGDSAPADAFARIATPVVATVLFIMALTLDSRQLLASLARPIPVLWALFVNVVFVPLIAWPLSKYQLLEDFTVGVAIVSAVPCTMAAASVWTRRAGGNDAVSLLVTLLTNGLCFAFTPPCIAWLIGRDVELDVWLMARRLALTAMLPAALGQVTRLLITRRVNVDAAKTSLGNIAQAGILVIVFGASMKASPQIGAVAGGASVGAFLWMTVCCLIIHFAAAAVAWFGARAVGMAREDAVACLFAGSQKTLPIAILIATDPRMLGSAGVPLAILPLLTFHALQLVLDTPLADYLRISIPRTDGPTR